MSRPAQGKPKLFTAQVRAAVGTWAECEGPAGGAGTGCAAEVIRLHTERQRSGPSERDRWHRDAREDVSTKSVQQNDMKAIVCIVLGIAALGFLVPASRAGEEIDKSLTQQVSAVLTECKKIAPGATRAELLKIFTSEGGISTAKHRTFVHRRCPYIKVDVDFTLSDPKQSLVDERATDTVKKVSRPYLEWSIID